MAHGAGEVVVGPLPSGDARASGLDVVRKVQQQPVDGQNLAAPVTIQRVWRMK